MLHLNDAINFGPDQFQIDLAELEVWVLPVAEDDHPIVMDGWWPIPDAMYDHCSTDWSDGGGTGCHVFEFESREKLDLALSCLLNEDGEWTESIEI